MLGVQSRDPRVVLLGRPEAALGFALLVVAVDPLDIEDGELAAGLVREGDAVARGRGGNSEANGERPKQSAGKAHLVHAAPVVLVAHESRERGERSARKHVEVGDLTGGERHRFERVEVFRCSPVASTSSPPCGRISCRSVAVLMPEDPHPGGDPCSRLKK